MRKRVAEILIAPSFVSATIALCFGIAIKIEKLTQNGSIVADWNSQEYRTYISLFILSIMFAVLCIYCIFVTLKENLNHENVKKIQEE